MVLFITMGLESPPSLEKKHIVTCPATDAILGGSCN